MATPTQLSTDAAATLGHWVCRSPVGWLFSDCREAAIAVAGDAATAAAASASSSTSGLVHDVGDELEDVIGATGQPLANAADIARWTTIGVIAIAVVILVLVAVFVFFYLRGFR